jgi:hypothetical protein
MVKLRLDSSKIGEYVRMIELKIVQHHSPRTIMNELGTLVGESRIVFVGFDHEERRIAKAR